jgi:hypothetical protein
MQHDDKDLLMRRVAAYLAIVVVLGFLGLGVMLTFREIPAANKETFLQFTGALTLAFGGLMGFLYGRSTASDAADHARNAAATGPRTADGTPKVHVDDAKPVAVEVKPARRK